MEEFPGVIIFATNNKKNIDEAFLRRLNTVVHFPMPAVAERYKIWGNSIAANTDFPKDVDLTAITQKYELTEASIVNAIYYASQQTIHRGDTLIQKNDLDEGIRREIEKAIGKSCKVSYK